MSLFFNLLRCVFVCRRGCINRIGKFFDSAKSFLFPPLVVAMPSYFLLSDDHWWEDGDEVVPEDSVLVEEWERDGVKKCRLHYEGWRTDSEFPSDPFDESPGKKPWIWIGDKTTEVDLTKAMEKFLVPGNTIKLDLLLQLLLVREDTEIIYICPRTYEEIKFPAEGVTIDEEDDLPVA